MENNKFHILIVDDDDKIRDLLRQFLKEKGFIVSTAENSQDAKSKIDIFNFNLIILDVMMPGQSGYELTKELKISKNIPIILLTAKGEVENRIHGLQLGADDYLGKPFDPQELLLRINNIIKNNDNRNLLEVTKIGEAELNLSKMTIKLREKIEKINSKRISNSKYILNGLKKASKNYSWFKPSFDKRTISASIAIILTYFTKSIHIFKSVKHIFSSCCTSRLINCCRCRSCFRRIRFCRI